LHSVYDDAGIDRIHREVRKTRPETLENTIRDLAAGKTGTSLLSNTDWDLGFKSVTVNDVTTRVPASAYRDAARLWFGNAGMGGVWQADSESLHIRDGDSTLNGFAKPSLASLSSDGLIP
ncbi:MAG: hypothetical protein ACK58T_22675, partial [Phycisphaerae bacterium]